MIKRTSSDNKKGDKRPYILPVLHKPTPASPCHAYRQVLLPSYMTDLGTTVKIGGASEGVFRFLFS